MSKFKMILVNGMDQTEVQCDSFMVVSDDGHHIELHPRKSDGDISLYAKGRLVIRPVAANCVTVKSEP